MNELEAVVLRRDLPEHGLEQGDIGTIVHVYRDGAACEVEFVTGEGETVAVATLGREDVRPMGSRDILHARERAA